MEKIMQLMACSMKKQRTWTREDGTQKLIDFYEVKLTDGTDTIFGETGGALTARIESTDEQTKVRLIEGHWYAVRCNFNTKDWEADGKSGVKVTVNVQQMMEMV